MFFIFCLFTSFCKVDESYNQIITTDNKSVSQNAQNRQNVSNQNQFAYPRNEPILMNSTKRTRLDEEDYDD
jgi:hypothetical protein